MIDYSVKMVYTASVEETVVHEKEHYFVVCVQTPFCTWKVEHRFQAFQDLHKQLVGKMVCMKGPKAPQPPPRRFFGSDDPEFVRQRKEQLGRYLHMLLMLRDVYLSDEMLTFLNLDNICRAASCSDRLQLKALIHKGAYLNFQDHKHQSALHHCCRVHDEAAVKLLANAGVNVNVKDREGLAPIHLAARKGLDGICEILVQYNANVNAQDREGLTPLHYAALMGKGRAARVLLEAPSIDTTLCDGFGRLPLHCAALMGHKEATRVLVDRSDINSTDSDGLTPLHYAAGEGHLSVVSHLMQKGADLLRCDEQGFTALAHAEREGHSKVVAVLKSAAIPQATASQREAVLRRTHSQEALPK